MSRILFCMLQETGHLNPTFKIARRLRERGHEVCYLAIPDLEENILRQGFECVPFLPDLYPSGLVRAQDELGTLRARRAITRRFRELTARILDPSGFRREIESIAPSVMAIDINHTLLSCLAWQLKIPVVEINATLPQTRDPGIPPLRSGALYSPGRRGELHAEYLWARFLIRRRLAAMAAGLVGMCPPYELARRAMPRFGIPVSLRDAKTVYMPRIIGPIELVLCPEGFDFPRPPRPERHFVESVDVDRAECDFPWHRLDPAKPLIFVSMGSQHHESRHVQRFFRVAARALAACPEWQIVLSLGRHLLPEDLGPCPEHLVVVRTAPQLAILKRTALMVTHGGLGSVKECIVFGVPMLVYPLSLDQPDNAARVEYHRIGLRRDIRNPSAGDLIDGIARILADPEPKRRIEILRRKFEATEATHRGAELIEAEIEGRRSGRDT